MKPNVYTWLLLAFFLSLWAAGFLWGGPFLLLPMVVRLGIGLGAVLVISVLGVASKLK